ADAITKEIFVDAEQVTYRGNSFTALQNWTKRILRHLVMAYMVYTFNILQNWYKALVNWCQPILLRLVNLMPVIMAGLAFTLMVIDQVTDIVSSYEICTVPCKCVWHDFFSHCNAPNNLNMPQCSVALGDLKQFRDHCNIAENESECYKVELWTPKVLRHPLYCSSSVATILLPSIINSTYLLTSMWFLYPSLLRCMGLSDSSSFFSSCLKITLLVLYFLQILPYTWIVINFLIHLKSWKIGATEGLDEKEARENTSKKSKYIFSILEDTPQLLFHSMFLFNSAITHENSNFDAVYSVYADIDMLHIWSYLGVASSAASIALTLTLFKDLSNYKATVLQFVTTFISVGTRASLCATYATSVLNDSGPLTWPIVLLPVTAIVLFTIEYIVCFAYRFAVDSR
ncbi:unnamed protein product, partial [Meganyctiphanes norvegica]